MLTVNSIYVKAWWWSYRECALALSFCFQYRIWWILTFAADSSLRILLLVLSKRIITKNNMFRSYYICILTFPTNLLKETHCFEWMHFMVRWPTFSLRCSRNPLVVYFISSEIRHMNRRNFDNKFLIFC